MSNQFNISQEDVTLSRRLFEAVLDGVSLTGAVLKALYAELRLGRGFFQRRKMSAEIEE